MRLNKLMQRLAISYNDIVADNMFTGKRLLGDKEENIELYTPPNLQEILVEIESQSGTLASITSPKQAVNVSNVVEYFASSFNNDSMLVWHFQCYYCKEKYLHFKALYYHANVEHNYSGNHPLKCFICQQLFVFTREYHDHLALNHQIRYPQAVCDICLTTFADTEALQKHLPSHPADYACQNCSTKFQSQDLLALHQEYHNCSNKLMCAICAASFHSKFLQGLHSLRHRQVECPLALNENCASMTSELELINHFKEHHQLNDRIVLLKTIKSHDKEEHELDELLQGGTNIGLHGQDFNYKSWLSKIKLKQEIQCSTCSVKLTSVFQLCIHFLKIHTNTKKCPYCEKHFKESSLILLHLGSKSCEVKSVTPLRCSQCEETFQQQHKLLEHQLTHVKPLQCSQCNAIFHKTHQLKSHLQSHGLLPEFPNPVFACPVCSSSWPSITHLRRHIRTHAGNRPFQCDHCGVTFKRQPALRAHCTSAHSEKSLACPHCDNMCRSKQALFLHVCRVHVRLRRFVCGLCAKPWPQNQDLRRHLSNVHKVEYPPLKSSAAKVGSFKSVHVIPPIDNLAEGDPLRLKITAIVEEEKEKLRSLNTNLDAEVPFPEDTGLKEKIHDKWDSASNEAQPPTEGISLNCAFCDFRCEDLCSWINHTGEHQQPSHPQSVSKQGYLNNQPVSEHLALNGPSVSGQLTLNSQPINDQHSLNSQLDSDRLALNSHQACNQQSSNSQAPLDFTVVHVVPVQPIFLSPAIPINYGTLVTVLPTLGNLSTVNEPYIPLTEQPIVLQETLNNSVLPSNQGTIENSPNPGELININGMFIRIEQFDGDEAKMINTAGPSISIENSSFTENDSSENTLAEVGAQENEFLVSEKSNLPQKINEEVEETVRLAAAAAKTVVQFDGDEVVRLEGPAQAQKSPVTGTGAPGKWSCQECGKVLSALKNLKRHMRVHSGEKPFTCEVCGKTFAERHNLKVHMLSHTQERPYCCSICGKKMRYVKECVEHEKKHKGIKDYTCSVCGRSFVRQRELVRHQMMHSSEKKYQCSKCLKSFLRLDYLRFVHMPQVHGNFSCTLCRKRFESEDKLQVHLRSHTLKEPCKLRAESNEFQCAVSKSK